MKPFEYVTAASPASAVELVGDDGRFFAGGIDVLGELKDGLDAPARLVNVKALPGTRSIELGADGWRIGANVTLAELAEHAELGDALPGLAQAAAEVGSPQIRNVATVAGNLAQHSRCWYYRHRDVHCLKGGGETCYARTGNDRHHSLFTGNPCLSPLVSNLAMILTALEATVEVQRGKTTMIMSMPDLYATAWQNPLAHNSLGRGDLILGVSIPDIANRSAYRQLSEKSDFDWALVSCAAAARVEGGTLHDPRLVLGVVAPVPFRKDEVDALLDGRRLTPELAATAADQLLDGAEPRSENGYKVPMARALVRRTLLQLVA